MATKRKQGQTLSLKGSTKIVTEFFEYSVNSCVLSPSDPCGSTLPPGSAGPLQTAVSELTRLQFHRILYQRGIYPPEDFKQVKKYGLTLFTSADEALERYISNVMKQVQSELPCPVSKPPALLLGRRLCTASVASCRPQS